MRQLSIRQQDESLFDRLPGKCWSSGSGASAQPPILSAPAALLPTVNQLGLKADHSPPSSAEVTNAWSYPSTPRYAFIEKFLIKYSQVLPCKTYLLVCVRVCVYTYWCLTCFFFFASIFISLADLNLAFPEPPAWRIASMRFARASLLSTGNAVDFWNKIPSLTDIFLIKRTMTCKYANQRWWVNTVNSKA